MVEDRARETGDDEFSRARRELEEARRHLAALQADQTAAKDGVIRRRSLRDALPTRSETVSVNRAPLDAPASLDGPASVDGPASWGAPTDAPTDTPTGGVSDDPDEPRPAAWDGLGSDDDAADMPEETDWTPGGEARRPGAPPEFDLDALAARVLGDGAPEIQSAPRATEPLELVVEHEPEPELEPEAELDAEPDMNASPSERVFGGNAAGVVVSMTSAPDLPPSPGTGAPKTGAAGNAPDTTGPGVAASEPEAPAAAIPAPATPIFVLPPSAPEPEAAPEPQVAVAEAAPVEAPSAAPTAAVADAPDETLRDAPAAAERPVELVMHGSARVGDDLEVVGTVQLKKGVQVGDDVRLGSGTVIRAGAVLGDEVAIGADVTVGRGATVDDGVGVGDHVVIKPGAVLGDDAEVGARSMIGGGAVVGEGGDVGAGVESTPARSWAKARTWATARCWAPGPGPTRARG